MIRRGFWLLMAAALCSATAFSKVGDFPTDWTVTDIHGKAHQPFASKETRAAVLVFIMPDCPIANYFQPALAELAKRFEPEGVRFFLLHSDKDTTVETAKQHAEEYKIEVPVVLDTEQKAARQAGATVTPEAFLIDRRGKVVYQGRINDLFTDLGKRRRTPRTHDLSDAIEAVLAGREVQPSKTNAIGCYISYE